MIKTQPYLEVMLRGGQTLVVKGSSIYDISSSIYKRTEWVVLERLTGEKVRVWSGDISAVVEDKFVDFEED
ncbi:hypothetical protein AB1K91_17705 [Terribacillus sp. 179-K 1B1 HS]|uniref:hypothetical protein n=1 Tax=Terribacillus sp. 179-K 1B1 HS TaxID=3142388 RepID=UPI0039A0B38F